MTRILNVPFIVKIIFAVLSVLIFNTPLYASKKNCMPTGPEINDIKQSIEYTEYKKNCIDGLGNINSNSKKGLDYLLTQESQLCVINAIQLSAKAFNLEFPLLKCMYGRESIKLDGAPYNVRLLNKSQNSDFEPQRYQLEANEGNGVGIGQLTKPAVIQANTLLNKTANNDTLSCELQKKFHLFYSLVGVNFMPKNLLKKIETNDEKQFYENSKSKKMARNNNKNNNIDYSKLNLFNFIHNISISSLYLSYRFNFIQNNKGFNNHIKNLKLQMKKKKKNSTINLNYFDSNEFKALMTYNDGNTPDINSINYAKAIFQCKNKVKEILGSRSTKAITIQK